MALGVALRKDGAPSAIVHLIDGELTACGRRRRDDPWPSDERWVFERHRQEVTCEACKGRMVAPSSA
jgi:hypothetical protein